MLANRKALADVLGAKISLISQVHSGDAVDVDESFVINQPFGFDVSGTKKPEDETDGENNATGNDGEPTVIEADGQVTSRKNVALGMFAADCLPVLMADPEAGVIGAAHCGRRGLQKGVIGATIEKMVSKGAQPERIVATLGPCICGDCYEGGGDIAERGEGLLEFVTIDAVRQVTNVDVHPSLLPFSTGFPSPAFPEQFFSHLPGCKLSLLFHPRRGRRTVGVMRGRAVGSRGLDGWLRILLT